MSNLPAETVTDRITSALEAATAGLTYAEFAPAIAAFLGTTSPALGTPAESRMDRAYAVIRGTHLGGTNWSLNVPLSAQKAGIGEVTLVRMRFTVRTLAEAGVIPTGRWQADHRHAKALAAASAGIAPSSPAPGAA